MVLFYCFYSHLNSSLIIVGIFYHNLKEYLFGTKIFYEIWQSFEKFVAVFLNLLVLSFFFNIRDVSRFNMAGLFLHERFYVLEYIKHRFLFFELMLWKYRKFLGEFLTDFSFVIQLKISFFNIRCQTLEYCYLIALLSTMQLERLQTANLGVEPLCRMVFLYP